MDNSRSNGQGAPGDALREALRMLGPDGAPRDGGASPLSPDALAELTRRAGLAGNARAVELGLVGLDPQSGRPAAGPTYVAFALGETVCAFAADAIQSVQRVASLTPVPNTADWVLGVTQLGGSIVSVVDLRRFLGQPPIALVPGSRLVVVARRGMTVACAVDALVDARGEARTQPVPPATPAWLAGYAASALEMGGQRMILLDVEALLFSDKMGRYRADGR